MSTDSPRRTARRALIDYVDREDDYRFGGLLYDLERAIEAESVGLDVALGIVNVQAEDEGLWFIAQTAPEAYLQQELRRLHAAIEAAREGNTP